MSPRGRPTCLSSKGLFSPFPELCTSSHFHLWPARSWPTQGPPIPAQSPGRYPRGHQSVVCSLLSRGGACLHAGSQDPPQTWTPEPLGRGGARESVFNHFPGWVCLAPASGNHCPHWFTPFPPPPRPSHQCQPWPISALGPPSPPPRSPAARTNTVILRVSGEAQKGTDCPVSALSSSPTPFSSPWTPTPDRGPWWTQPLGSPGWGGPCWLTHTGSPGGTKLQSPAAPGRNPESLGLCDSAAPAVLHRPVYSPRSVHAWPRSSHGTRMPTDP